MYVYNSNKNVIGVGTASEIIAESLAMFRECISAGELSPPTMNMIFLGGTGIGKTAFTRAGIKKFFGLTDSEPLTEKIYTVNGVRIGFREYGASMEVSQVMLPSVSPSSEITEECQYFIDEADNSTGAKSAVMRESAIKSRKNHLRYIVEETLDTYISKCDMILIASHDSNKSTDPSVDSLIKGFMDKKISSTSTPPVLVLGTMNPYSSKRNNKPLDDTTKSAAQVYYVKVDESVLPFMCKRMPEMIDFFKENMDIVYDTTKDVGVEESEQTGCPRMWDSLLLMTVRGVPQHLYSPMCCAMVGVKATQRFIKELNSHNNSRLVVNNLNDIVKDLNTGVIVNAKKIIPLIYAQYGIKGILSVLEGIDYQKKVAFCNAILDLGTIDPHIGTSEYDKILEITASFR